MNIRRIFATTVLAGAAAAIMPAGAGAAASVEFPSDSGLPEPLMQIESWSWGMNQGTGSHGGGHGAGKVSVQDLNYTRPVSSGSPALAHAVAKGNHFPSAVIRTQPNPGSMLSVGVCMQDVVVSNYEVSYQGGGSGDPVPTESVSLNFAKIRYVVQADASFLTFTYDVKKNTARLSTNNECA